ncbi:MAG: GC-type dockerin domain-anchored protein [Planctomycetota bacterium]
MRSHALRTVCALVTLSCLTHVATAQHAGDIYVEDHDGVLRTGAVNQDQSLDVPLAVFAATFNAGGFTSNPGYDTVPPMFEVGTRIGLNFRGPLLVWTGCGFEPAEDEFLRLSFFTAFADSTDGFQSGFDLAVESNGGWHKHYTYSLQHPSSTPATGIYAMEWELYSTDPDLATSEPFWHVYNFGDSFANHDQAVAWAVANFGVTPPCPADIAPENPDGSVGNGIINIDDLLRVINEFGQTDSPADASPDNCDGTFGNGAVNIDDILFIINSFGMSCDA